MAKIKKKKLEIPDSVKELRYSYKKFAKKHGIRIKGKGMSKKERKRQMKKLHAEYCRCAVKGLNKAVKIMAEHPDAKNIDKVREGVENIIKNAAVMKKVAKYYRKDKEAYPNMIFLPNMIMNTILYYSREDMSEEDKAIAETLNKDALIEFCEKILKKETKRYQKFGLPEPMAYQLATVIPTGKLFKKQRGRTWYRRLIETMFNIAEVQEVNPDQILMAVYKIDKKDRLDKDEFLQGFFSEFIMQRASNKVAKYTETQKELYDGLIDRTLMYLNGLKKKKLRVILKNYIERRKSAEEYKNDTKRIIKFTDHANSNSPYETIKAVVHDLIESNSSNELYLQ